MMKEDFGSRSSSLATSQAVLRIRIRIFLEDRSGSPSKSKVWRYRGSEPWRLTLKPGRVCRSGFQIPIGLIRILIRINI